MYIQFGQKTILPQVLVNLIWSYDDNKCFYKHRLNERLRFELDIFNNFSELYPYSSAFNPYGYMSSHHKPTYSVYILNKIKYFGDRVPNENLPHFIFKNYL